MIHREITAAQVRRIGRAALVFHPCRDHSRRLGAPTLEAGELIFSVEIPLRLIVLWLHTQQSQAQPVQVSTR
jgi:hypothetical protein